MTHTPLTVAARRLDISLYTLRQWCQKAGIDLEQQKSLSDPRQKWVTDEQLQQLAQEHGRLLDQEAEAEEPIPVNAYRLLVEQIAEIVQQAEQINANHATLQAEMAELHSQQETIASLVAGIQRATHEQGTQHQQVIGALQEEQRQTHTALGEMSAHQQEHHQLLEQHAPLLSKLQERATSLETEARSHASRLGELSAHVDNQDKELAQLATALDDLTKQMQTEAEQAKQAQMHLQEQVEQVEKRLQAEFQEALVTVCRQMLEEFDKRYLSADFALEFEQRTQHIEADHARNVTTITAQQKQQAEHIEQLDSRITSAASGAEEAKRAAVGQQGRIFKVEQDVTNFGAQLQAQMMTTSTMTGRLTRLEVQAAQEQGATQEKPKRSARKAEPGT